MSGGGGRGREGGRGVERKGERKRRGRGREGRGERRRRGRGGENFIFFLFTKQSVLCLFGDTHESDTENTLDEITGTGGLQGRKLP